MKKVLIEYSSATYGAIRITRHSPITLAIHTASDNFIKITDLYEAAVWLLEVHIAENAYLLAAPARFVDAYRNVIGPALRKELSDLLEF